MKALSRIPLALPLLAVPLLVAMTSGSTAIPPIAAVVIAAAAVFAFVAGTERQALRPWLDLPLAAGLGLAASHLLFFPGLPRGHDTLNHLWGVWSVSSEVAAGSVAALWVHGLNLGTPLLQFYGPLSLYTAVPFSLAGLSPEAALKAAFLVFGAGSAATQCFAVSRWTGDRRAGLVAAAAYTFAPYRLLAAHYRAALGECAAMAILPLVFLYGMAAVREGGRRRMAAAAIVLALLTITHPISVLMAGVCLGIWTLALPAETPRPLAELGRRLVRLVGIAVLGAALAGFFVVPFMSGVRHVVVSTWFGKIGNFFVSQALAPQDLVHRRLWTDLRFSIGYGEDGNGTEREMPFYFGLILLSLVPLGAAKAPRGLVWMTVGSLAFALHPMAWVLVRIFPQIQSLQFAWRFLGPASCGAAAIAGFAALRLLDLAKGRRWVVPATRAVPGALIALLLLDALPYTGAADWFPAYKQFGSIVHAEPCDGRWGCWQVNPLGPPGPFRVAGLFVPPLKPAPLGIFCCVYTPEYLTPVVQDVFKPEVDRQGLVRAGVKWLALPLLTQARPQGARPYASWWNGHGQPEPRTFTRGAGEITVELDGRPGTVLVVEMYFPGWQALTKHGWREVQPSWEGLLLAPVAAGQRVLRLHYNIWTPARIAGCALSLLTALSLLVLESRDRGGREGRTLPSLPTPGSASAGPRLSGTSPACRR